MGWMKRSSRSRYDALSGHAFLLGGYSKKIIIEGIVTAKQCSVCSAAEAKGEEATDHECPRNYRGSSKAMEADSALHLVQKIHRDTNKKVFIERIVADDDLSMHAILNHASDNKKGKLPQEIPQPRWLADPTHRIKVVAKAMFILASAPSSESIHICGCSQI